MDACRGDSTSLFPRYPAAEAVFCTAIFNKSISAPVCDPFEKATSFCIILRILPLIRSRMISESFSVSPLFLMINLNASKIQTINERSPENGTGRKSAFVGSNIASSDVEVRPGKIRS